MPFTPSHAVVALPFVRTPLVPAAIAVGAMTPDLPLFVRVGVPSYSATHDVAGIGVTVLLALALLLVWRCVLRPAVGELAPRFIAARLPGEWDGTAAQALRATFGATGGRVRVGAVALLAVSLVIGILSHIAWDAFTHEGRIGVELLPALAEQWGPMLGLKWLQHGSSALGLVIIGVWASVQLTRAPRRKIARVLPSWVRVGWWLSLPAALVAAWVIGVATHGPIDAQFTVAHLAYRVLPPACAMWGAATLVLALSVPIARSAENRGKPARHARDAAEFADPADPT